MEKQKYNVTNFLHIYKRSNYHNFVYLKRIDAQLQKKMKQIAVQLLKIGLLIPYTDCEIPWSIYHI